MADNNRGYGGFRHVRSFMGGMPPNPIACRVASGYSGAISGGSTIDINIGDPVRFVADGTVAHAAGSETTTQDIFGIVVNILPYWDGVKRTPGFRLPAGTTYGSVLERQSFVEVVPVVNNVWEIDVDDNTTATTEAGYAAMIGSNADHRFTTGSEPKSNCLLDISSSATTATLQWRILNISQSVANQDFSGAYVKLYVVCNRTQAAPFNTTGI